MIMPGGAGSPLQVRASGNDLTLFPMTSEVFALRQCETPERNTESLLSPDATARECIGNTRLSIR
jgi:hypothetical protein